MRKFFKWLLVGSTILLCLLIALTGLVLLGPELLFNSKTVDLAQKYFFQPRGITWTDNQTTIRSLSPLVKEITISLDNPTVVSATLEMVAKHAEATLTLRLGPISNMLQRLGPIQVTGLIIGLRGDLASSERQTTPFEPPSLLNHLADTIIEPVNIDITRITYIDDKRRFEASGRFNLSGYKKSFSDQLTLALDQIKGLGLSSLMVEMGITNYRHLLDPNAAVYAKIIGRGKAESITGEFQLTETKNAARNIEGSLKANIATLRGSGNFSGNLTADKARGQLALKISSIRGYQTDLTLAPCQFRADWEYPDASNFDIGIHSCSGSMRRLRIADEHLIADFLPPIMHFAVANTTKLGGSGDNRRLITTTDVHLTEIKTAAYHLFGSATLKALVFANRPSKKDLSLNFDLNPSIINFQNLVNKLRYTAWAIPAPINNLDGKVDCKIQGTFQTLRGKGSVPLVCDLALASPTQSLVATTKGDILISLQGKNLQPEVHLSTTVRKMEVVLPRLQVGAPLPALFKDDRIIIDGEAPARLPRTEIHYDITVISATDNSIIVHSNLIKEPIPLGINARLIKDKPITGEIKVSAFEAEILRRKVKLQNFEMQLADEPENRNIKGRIEIDNIDYLVFLNIYGTMAQPVYVFESQPPIPEEDILSIILFGAPGDTLDFDAQRSVDEARAAIANNAIGLISMYYLASTPIESIGYNPYTQMFTARVRLGEGLSVTLGTDAEERQLALHRRLSRRWDLETAATHNETTGTVRGTAMLKWRLRY